LVLVSLSLLAGSDQKDMEEKFEKNQYKQEPSYFYSRLTDEKKEEAKNSNKNIREFLTFTKPHDTMKKIHLPEKILMLSASMPDKKSYPVQVKVDTRPQPAQISNIGDLGDHNC